MLCKKDLIDAVLIPHAGGSASELREFSAVLQGRFNVTAYELPGRGRRRSELPVTALADVLSDLISVIPETGPVVIIGYSFGAYLALLVAHHLRIAQAERSITLVLLANEPIHKRRYYLRGIPEKKRTDFLKDFCEQMGGVSESVMADDWLRNQLFRKLTDDLLVADQVPFNLPLLGNAPVLIIYGRDDPLVTSDMDKWQELFGASIKLVSVPGGHFVLQSHSRLVFNELIAFYEIGQLSTSTGSIRHDNCRLNG